MKKFFNFQKAKLRYEKVERRFRGDVKEDKITLHACQTKHSVSSYDLKVRSFNPYNFLTLKILGYSCWNTAGTGTDFNSFRKITWGVSRWHPSHASRRPSGQPITDEQSSRNTRGRHRYGQNRFFSVESDSKGWREKIEERKAKSWVAKIAQKSTRWKIYQSERWRRNSNR